MLWTPVAGRQQFNSADRAGGRKKFLDRAATLGHTVVSVIRPSLNVNAPWAIVGMIMKHSVNFRSALMLVYGMFTGMTAFWVYVKTLAPTVSFFDSGELISAAYSFGVAHPPGYPLYVLLGWLFGHLPLGEFAYRINLMSALFAALATLMVYGICSVCLMLAAQKRCPKTSPAADDTPDPEQMLRPALAMIAALSFAFSLTHWQHAVIAEVYSLNAFLCGLIVLLLLWWYRGNSVGSRQGAVGSGQGAVDGDLELRTADCGLPTADRSLPPAPCRLPTADWLLLLIAFLFGLGFGNHQTISLLAIPACFLVLTTRPRIILQGKTLAAILLCLLLGLSIYGLAPWRAAQNPAVNWGNPTNWAQFKWLVMREAYENVPSGDALKTLWDELFGEDAGQRLFPDGTQDGQPRMVKKQGIARYYNVLKFSLFWKQLRSFDPLGQFGWFGCVLALIGLVYSLFLDRRLGLTLLIAVCSLVLIIVLIGDPPEENIFLVKEFHTPAYLLTAVWLGLGMMALAKALLWLAPWRKLQYVLVLVSAVYFLIPVGARMLQNLPEVDRRRNYVAYDYATNIMTSLHKNAILFTWGDSGAFPLWYLQIVEQQRPDVTLIHVPHLTAPWFLDQLPPDLFESPAPFDEYGRDLVALLEDIVRKNRTARPIYFDFSSAHSLILPYPLLPNGITYKVMLPGEQIDETVWERYRFRGLLDHTHVARDQDIERTFMMYGSARMELGNYYLELGELEKATREFNLAVQLAPELGEGIVQSLKFRDRLAGERSVELPGPRNSAQ